MWARRFGMHGFGPLFGRGAIKFIILDLLKDQSKHGYEIMKDIEDKVGGFYASSPGSVYPTLQMLEDQGYVTSSEKNGKRVYQITDEGKKYLEQNKDAMDDIQGKHALSARFSQEQREIMREMRSLIAALAHEARRGKLQPEKSKKVLDVLVKARREIEDLLS
jgi:DNA-binding PadR family transcriptional regulator